MRAQVFHGPGDLRLEEIPVPEPEPGGVVVRVQAALDAARPAAIGTVLQATSRGGSAMCSP